MIWRALIPLLFLYSFHVASAECPINLDYVTQMPWNSSYCQSTRTPAQLENCRTTLRTVIGVGLAQFLREQSIFELPSYASAAACFSKFQQKLTSMGLPPNLVQLCFNDTSDYVSNPNLCGGIKTKQDWIQKLGLTSLDIACQGDLSGASACAACFASGEAVHRELTDMIKNISEKTSRKCYYFICLYAAGVANELGPMTTQAASCILRVPFLEKKPNRRILFFGFTGAAIGFLVLSALGLGYCFWVRLKGKANHMYFVRNNRNLLRGALKPNMGAVWFNIQLIRNATGNFSDANVVGRGSFGTVYKGVLADGGRPIAVKKITNCDSEGETEFINEVEIINSIRHRNLVVLRGFCVSSDDKEGRQRFLIYDFMANGSLDEYIFGGNSGNLSWEQRKNIAIGTAKGLCYLHYGVQPAIYHRDIKATNILLDDQMNACVADFGLARMTTQGQSHLTTRIAGTHGYLAPEYALYGQLTDRSDVYSFGVVLLEIVSGRKALDTSAAEFLITDWAWKLVKAGKTFQVIDGRIRADGPQSTMERFVLVGILCSHVMVAFRPSMVEALKMLEGDAHIPEIPDRPLPLTNRGIFADEHGDGDSSVSDSLPSFSSFTILR